MARGSSGWPRQAPYVISGEKRVPPTSRASPTSGASISSCLILSCLYLRAVLKTLELWARRKLFPHTHKDMHTLTIFLLFSFFNIGITINQAPTASYCDSPIQLLAGWLGCMSVSQCRDHDHVAPSTNQFMPLRMLSPNASS